MATKVHSSRPGINHADAFYSLIRPHGGAGPLMYYGPIQHSTHTPNVSDPLSAYQHGPHLHQDENVFAGDDNDNIADDYSPLHSPLGNAMDHIEGDNNNNMMLGSPSPVAGKKHQLPSSPSPPPSPPKPFVMPLRTPASTYNNRLAFGIQKP
ncbi:hypothetical protein BDR07DRAFT_1382013 [Suillus spraguei]|nr:hypothetical protein BDR07DRAFT_1382013 [Suillus spraguei]